MKKGNEYFRGEHDILRASRSIIGRDGKQVEVSNLPNNKIIDNQYRKMVVQKSNYLVGKPICIQGDNREYLRYLKKVINKHFFKVIKNICEDSLNCGIGYLFIGYDEEGILKTRRLDPLEIIPIWEDSEHEKLSLVIRAYKKKVIEKGIEVTYDKVEVYSQSGIDYFDYTNGKLRNDFPYHKDYFYKNDARVNEEA